jgi:hypothetical protein
VICASLAKLQVPVDQAFLLFFLDLFCIRIRIWRVHIRICKICTVHQFQVCSMHWNVCCRLGKGSGIALTLSKKVPHPSRPTQRSRERMFIRETSPSLWLATESVSNVVLACATRWITTNILHWKFNQPTNQPNGKLTNSVDVAWSVQGQRKRAKFTYKRP